METICRRIIKQHSCGTGLILQTPSVKQMEYAIRIGFKATNNKAEYEALLVGLRVATKMGINFLNTFSDSQLVVNQVQGDYLAKNTRMLAYLYEVKIIYEKSNILELVRSREKRTRRLMLWLTSPRPLIISRT